jgi:hypothetical protein
MTTSFEPTQGRCRREQQYLCWTEKPDIQNPSQKPVLIPTLVIGMFESRQRLFLPEYKADDMSERE